MTEAVPYVAFQKKGMDVSTDTVGPLLPGIRCALKVHGTAEDAPEGGPGELWINGPNVASGTIMGMCTIDEDGFLAVVGRTKDLIKYKGFHVSPVELDVYLNRHPLVWRVGSERVAPECNYEDFED